MFRLYYQHPRNLTLLLLVLRSRRVITHMLWEEEFISVGVTSPKVAGANGRAIFVKIAPWR